MRAAALFALAVAAAAGPWDRHAPAWPERGGGVCRDRHAPAWPECGGGVCRDRHAPAWPLQEGAPGTATAIDGPAAGDLNPIVLEVLGRYPTDGTHAYHWPKEGSWRGCTKDLVYDGQKLCDGDPEKRCYCCGLTFEVFLDAWMAWCRQKKLPERIPGFDLAKVRALQTSWFGSASDRSCVHSALVPNKLGLRITDWEQAKAGDFVQLWRNDGSGHSVVFLEWVREGSKIAGLSYWSTQKATKGIGRHSERFGDGKKDLKRDEFWLVRAGLAR